MQRKRRSDNGIDASSSLSFSGVVVIVSAPVCSSFNSISKYSSRLPSSSSSWPRSSSLSSSVSAFLLTSPGPTRIRSKKNTNKKLYATQCCGTEPFFLLSFFPNYWYFCCPRSRNFLLLEGYIMGLHGDVFPSWDSNLSSLTLTSFTWQYRYRFRPFLVNHCLQDGLLL